MQNLHEAQNLHVYMMRARLREFDLLVNLVKSLTYRIYPAIILSDRELLAELLRKL